MEKGDWRWPPPSIALFAVGPRKEDNTLQHLMAARTTVIKARMAEGRIKRGRERPTNQTRANPLRVVSPEKRMFPLGGQDNLNFPRQPGEDVHRCISITPLNRIRYERQIQTLTTTKLADVTDERPLAAFSFLRAVSRRVA